jgi:hypothetical protein
VGLLDKFEHSMENLVEGTFGSVFRQTLQPAEIGKKLERAMTGNTRVSVGTTLVPNDFVVKLHPKDFAQFAEYTSALARQMESFLAQKASQNRYTVVDRIHVSIEQADNVRRRSPDITASIKDSRGAGAAPRLPKPEPADRTAAFTVAREPAASRSFQLQGISGQATGKTFTVPPGSSTIGRAPGNALTIDAPDVSRKHAKLEFSSGRLRIYDLNSTNGTRINGDAVRISDLEAGDEITLGNQVLRVTVTGAGQRRH